MFEQGQQRTGYTWRALAWTAIAMLLTIPFIAMQFTNEVRWTVFDFAVASGLLIGAMAIYEIATRLVADRRRRMIIGGALILIVLLLWAQGAVGII